MVRDPERASGLRAAGAEVVHGEFGDPASLRAATQGVDAVFLQVPTSVEAHQIPAAARAALEAVRAAGSLHTVVTTSSVVPQARTGSPAPDARLDLVEVIAELAPHAVVLIPTLYLENFSGPLRAALDAGVIPYPIPEDVPVRYLSLDDHAASAIAALDRPHLAGQHLRVAGPDSLTGTQLAQTLSAALLRPLHYQAITPDAFGGQLAAFLPRPVADAVAGMYAWEGAAGAPLLNPDPSATTTALGVQLTTVAHWASTALLPTRTSARTT